MYVQFVKNSISKNVGIVKINLGECVDVPEAIKKRVRIDKLNTAYEGFIEFSLKSSLVGGSNGDSLSQMSDVISVDSGVDSEFDIDDFEEEAKEGSGAGGLRRGRKPATVIKTSIKNSNDPTKPPLMIGKAVPVGADGSGAAGGFDPQSLINSSNQSRQLAMSNTLSRHNSSEEGAKTGGVSGVSESLNNKIKMLRANGFKKQTIS